MSIGYKEWTRVCEALGEGRQHVLLRKGGIAEGRDGFAFKHDAFFFFPSYFHEQEQHLRSTASRDGGEGEGGESDLASEAEGAVEEITVRYHAEIVSKLVIDDWKVVEALEDFHIWKREIVRERFDYSGNACLHFALVRVHRLAECWTFPNQRSFGGCRSWLELPELPETLRQTMEPVIDHGSFGKVKQAVDDLTSAGSQPFTT